MLSGLGVLGLVAILVVVVAAAVGVVLYFRLGVFRRRKGRGAGKSGLLEESRIEVLERTKVDADRQLVLVRCDRIEHLIMVGGPADLVVENDVKKVRGPGVPAPKPVTPEAGQRAAGALLESPSRSPAAERTSPAPASAGARGGPAAVAGAASRTASPGPATRPNEARDQRQWPGESQSSRSGSGPQRRTIQPAPLGGSRPEPGGRPEPGRERQTQAGRGNGRPGAETSGLPAAGVPWPEPDSIENEIVRALRVDPVARGGGIAAKPRPPISAKSTTDPSTTLGDLAERLEEALAEEVQSASGRRKPEPDVDEFAFDAQAGGGAGQRGGPGEQKGRAGKKEEAPQRASGASGPSPEPDRRRQSPGSGERREEAPVISLNARRRENSDPLEDEMARLLGELTGDTKGR
jgi:hypothetical protein